MLVGFIHGVMNTDNMTISGETIDYGPCAFMDAYDPATVFSSIDHGGRYAYGNQPRDRAVEPRPPRRDAAAADRPDDTDAAVAAATEVLQTFPDRYRGHWQRGHARQARPRRRRAATTASWSTTCSALLHAQRVDFTVVLPGAVGARCAATRARCASLFADAGGVRRLARRAGAPRSARDGGPAGDRADAMDRVNPVYIPRNHLVEEALAAATAGDLEPFERLLDVARAAVRRAPGPRALRRAGAGRASARYRRSAAPDPPGPGSRH